MVDVWAEDDNVALAWLDPHERQLYRQQSEAGHQDTAYYDNARVSYARDPYY